MKYLILLFFFISCWPATDYIDRQKERKVTNINFVLSNLKELDWRVGRKEKVTVSKGFMVTLAYSRLSGEIKKKLLHGSGIDAWILRVRRIEGNGLKETIGYVHILLRSPGVSWISKIFEKKDKMIVRLNYQAVAPGKRFEMFPCPAFDHNKRIVKIEIEDKDSRSKTIRVFPGKDFRARTISFSQVGIRPIELNGGESLRGTYQFSFAFYNSNEKTLYSDFIDIGSRVEVISEDSVPIPGCDNFQIPERAKSIDKIKIFKFGR